MAHLNSISLDKLIDNTSNCRVKRHLMTSSPQKHGRPAEAEPDSTICTQRKKWVASFYTPNFVQKFLESDNNQLKKLSDPFNQSKK
jgi:hypothetical protein